MMDVHAVRRLFHVLIVLSGIWAITGEEDKENIKEKNEPNLDLQLKDIVFIVISQKNPYHEKRAEVFQQHFNDQLQGMPDNEKPELVFLHKKHRKVLGAWNLFPLLPVFSKDYADAAWVFFCEEETRLDLRKLVKELQRFDHKKDLYLGHPLRDQSATIIHHYAFHDNPAQFAYADWGAGFLLSQSLLAKVGAKWPDPNFRADFTIDPKHELAKFIHSETIGVSLTPVTALCLLKKSKSCATWYPTKFPDCGPEIPEEDLYVAVKTCAKFHRERVPVVRKTWGKDTKNLEFYSDVESRNIPTINLGVPNTERGHCGKTMAIIKRLHTKISSIPWFIITDDDTIINLARLRKLLACYNPNYPLHMGEKYGYMVTKNEHGYTYITGGGGMVFSKEAIDVLVRTNRATCPADDSPDDMIIGRAFKAIGLPLVHSPYFHQARPQDYSPEFLSARLAISFHKHWMIDPYKVYEDLVKTNDLDDSGQTDKDNENLIVQSSKHSKEEKIQLPKDEL